jgi:AAA ATPase domain
MVQAATPSVPRTPPKWLREVIAACTAAEADRPSVAQLIPRLSVDWDLQLQMILNAGWRIDEHPDFTGRSFIFEEFEEYAGQQRARGQGGLFLVTAPMGVGKTALLQHWAHRGGPFPGFFFRFRDQRTDPHEMPRQLFQILCQRFEQTATWDDNPQKYATQLLGLLQSIAQQKLSPSERLLVFIDGLDESSEPEKAAQFIPKPPLPPGVFLIVASRPLAQGQDHLVSLRSADVRSVAIEANRQQNLDDLRNYFQRKLQGVSTQQVSALATRTGGMFQLATSLVRDVLTRVGAATGEKRPQALAAAVEQILSASGNWDQLSNGDRLFAYYGESWRRIQLSVRDDAALTCLREFASLMTAARSWVSEEQILRILEWKETVFKPRQPLLWGPDRLEWACQQFDWMLERRAQKGHAYAPMFLQLRHQSLLEYLTLPQHRGPAHLGLKDMHACVGRYYLKQARVDGWEFVEPYGRFHAVRHLLECRSHQHLAEAVRCLTDLLFLHGTLGDEPADPGRAEYKESP